MSPDDIAAHERWCDEWESYAAALTNARELDADVLGEFVSTLRDIRGLPEDN